MGEEQKAEEKKEEVREEVKEEKKEDEKKEGEPPEIVIRVDMHCEGCARKVARSLRGFEGVEEVKTDCKSRTVVVKGKGADPVKVCERVQKKTGRKTELISPLLKPPEEEKKEVGKEDSQQEEKKEETKPVTVVLKVRMHCDACAQGLQKRIKKMDGVESVETDLPNDQVIVKGIMDPVKLVEYVNKRTRKQAVIVKDEESKEEEKKGEEGEKKEEKSEEGEKKDEEDDKKIEAKRFEYRPPKYYNIEYAYQPTQMFSDENPNACSIM